MTISNSARSMLATGLASPSVANEIVNAIDAANGVSTGPKTITAGATAAATALRFGATATEGLEIKVIDEVVTLTNAVSTNLTNTVPAGAVILSVQANLNSLVVGDASGDDLLAKVGIGISGSVVKYGVTSALTKNLKVDTIPTHAVLGSAEQIGVYTLKTDGTTAATEKFVAGGLVRVRIAYFVPNSLDDAA